MILLNPEIMMLSKQHQTDNENFESIKGCADDVETLSNYMMCRGGIESRTNSLATASLTDEEP